MNKNERVVENLNRALHELFASDPRVFLLGEDILDPYGGAFKVSRGLSSRFAGRVLATPLSEATFLGIGGGLALCGEKVIVEIMFGDFLALGYDIILNFVSKATAMYGRPLAINLVVRCPVGGNRAYGPTHSQSMQKYFLGIPHLSLFELSPFHDNTLLLNKLINLGQPCILFEDKVLYTQRMAVDGVIDDYFAWEALDHKGNFIRVFLDGDGAVVPDCLLIAPGGMVARCLHAMKDLLLNDEISTQLIVPSQLYPFDVNTLVTALPSIKHIAIVEESTAGGTWGSEVAQQLYPQLWGKLKQPIQLIHSRACVIPTASHLEKQVLVQAEDISCAIRRAIYVTD
ncbi:alpha-ketoacid dehydrogenase subunit beta [Dictyobacter aurantiacus]|uniref:Pyruvate dehydrogenase E1 component subunit beta n=1 Tax=Dictyobacter aurantiacus TaxID=1936993 RepID=A0A401ZLF9_9CHLR|nr:transketolase C-terminal domain-containing protein [Dictyobacter aurantiacus]GCE07676.1 pyruvate dehydrogenase [Dictyobacter aurantiacus]